MPKESPGECVITPLKGKMDGNERKMEGKSRACHAKLKHRGPEPRCRARAYITPLAEQKVAPLPRRGPEPRCRARAYITPLAEQKVARLPRETEAQRPGAQVPRQSVHHAPCRAESRAPRRGPEPRCRARAHHESRKSRACHAKLKHRGPEPRCRARAYITPLAEQKVARHAEARSPGAAPERTSRPLQSRKSRACHAKLKHRGPEPRCRARAYITPLAEQKVARLPRKTEAQRPGAQVPRQSVHHAPCRAESRARACQSESRAAATQRPGAQVPRQSVHHAPCRAESRAPCHAKLKHRGPEPRCRARAYITPLAEQKVARLPRETEAQRPGAQVPRQSVHHAPCRAESRAPATRN